MNKCGNCKHWVEWQEKNVGTCTKIPHVDSRYKMENNLAATNDHERYDSCLYTKPDFGCVLWELKLTVGS